jgi:hypothetical protein
VAKPFGFLKDCFLGSSAFSHLMLFLDKNSREESQEEACQNFYRSDRPEIAVFWGSPVFLSTTN